MHALEGRTNMVTARIEDAEAAALAVLELEAAQGPGDVSDGLVTGVLGTRGGIR